MSRFTRWWRSAAAVAAVAVAGAGLTAITTGPAQAADEQISDATFTWGINGYAQQGIFAAWEFSDLQGNVEYLDGGEQQEYLVDPVPATSFPTNARAGDTPNAVKFSSGEGTLDRETGAAELSWDGSYTVNAYPPNFGAPSEIYEDPQLSIDDSGAGELTVHFKLGAGVDMEGNPVDEQDFGRITLLTFDDGSISELSGTGYRVTPDYQGVENGIEGQATECTTNGGATGWWGSWPQEFIDAIKDTAVVAHFYSTSCGGLQDYKPALPFDIGYGAPPAQIDADATSFSAEGTHQVTVTGSNFTTTGNLGTRPPLADKPGGVYVAFGYIGDPWKPSEGAPGSARVTKDVKWALPGESYDIVSGTPQGADAIEMNEDGSFSAELEVAHDPDAEGTPAIFVYPGSGAANADEELAVPITFTSSFSDVPADHQFYDEITWLADQGITTGMPDGSFRPTAHVERQAMAAFLYRYAGEPEWEAPAESPFSDVPTDHQFYKEITWLADQGITEGLPDGTFRPTATIERQAMAAFIYRFSGEPEHNGDSSFSDVPANHQFAKEIAWLADTGITTGLPDGSFRPNAGVERQATAAFLLRHSQMDAE